MTALSNVMTRKAIGELGTVRLAKHWSPVRIRAAVLLRRADVVGSKVDDGLGVGRLLVDNELRESAQSLPPTVSDPSLLVLDQKEWLHLVTVERRAFSVRPGHGVMRWSTSGATVRSRHGRGKNLLRVVEISDGSETLTLLAECLDPRQRAALELIERITDSRADAAVAG